jgi:hypothetical protein
MAGIFISYRQEDTKAWAQILQHHLANAFGKEIFLDKCSVHAGDWSAQIENALKRSDVFIVMIGKLWLTIKDAENTRRIDLPHDVHRMEIVTALRSRGVTVIPVLVDGARMPTSDELGPDLHPLLKCQVRLLGDIEARIQADVGALIRDILRVTRRRFFSKRAILAVFALAAALTVNAFLRNDSAVLATMFLALGAGLSILAVQAYGEIQRKPYLSGHRVVIALAILAALLVIGSAWRLGRQSCAKSVGAMYAPQGGRCNAKLDARATLDV